MFDKLPSLYHTLHAYVSWWVMLAIFLGLIGLLWKYYPYDGEEEEEEEEGDVGTHRTR